jgi:hypothetical protein
MVELVFHRLAAQEYRSAERWYAARSPGTSCRFRDAVNLAVDRIVADPDSHAFTSNTRRYR